jgi:hypothetical protein
MSQILDRSASSSNHKPKNGDSIPKHDGLSKVHASCCKRHALRYSDAVDEFDLVALPEVCSGADRRRAPRRDGRGIVAACLIGLLSWLYFLAWLAS